MKYLPLVVAALLRRKLRTALTVGSFAIALLLFCLLVTIRDAFNQGIEAAGADRMFVINKVSLIQPLPLAHKQRIERVPGVRLITYASWFGGVYQNPRNVFPQFAIEPESYRRAFDEFVIPEDQWKAFLADRAGCIVGGDTLRRYGWKLGDRIPIQGAIYPGLWEFNLRGSYEGSAPNQDLTQFWFQQAYLDEKTPAEWKGLVGWYVVRVARAFDNAAVAKAIDTTFANSAWETRTQTESAFAASFVKQVGNIQLLMLVVGGVVVLTLLLVTGNTLSASVRERTGELAVLKTVGFADRTLLGLLLAESQAIAGSGALIGIALAKSFTLLGNPTRGLLPSFYLSPGAMTAALGLALSVGVVAGLAPAVAAMRLQVVEALRKL